MRQIKLFVFAASLSLLGACSGMPQVPDGTQADAAPAQLNCLQGTGSRIKPPAGQCLNVAGKVYTAEQVRQSGAFNTAEALHRLGL